MAAPKKRFSWWYAVAAVAVLLVGTAFGLVFWKSKQIENRAVAFLDAVREIRTNDSPAKALQLIKTGTPNDLPEAYAGELEELTRSLTAEAADLREMHKMLHREPELVLKDENLALLKVRESLVVGNEKEATRLIENWKDVGEKGSDWFFLKLAKEAGSRNPDEAKRILDAAGEFEVADEKTLVHEAIFAAAEDEQKAWDLLIKAYEANPRDWHVRLFLGNFLEKRGNHRAAQREYVAALLLEPENILLRNNLASFYHRYGRLGSAMQTLLDAPDNKLPSFLWARLNYWSRLYREVEMPELDPSGVSAGQARLLSSIPQGAYWNETASAVAKKLPGLSEHDSQQFWLQMIDACRRDDLTAIKDLLLLPPKLAKIEEPHLLTTLQFLVRLRETKPEDLTTIHIRFPATGKTHHDFFKELAALDTEDASPQFLDFCRAKEGFVATFLAAGWTQAAVALLPDTKAPEAAPDWYAYGVAKSLQYCSGPEIAAAWLDKNNLDRPELILQRAEMDFVLEKQEEGLNRLTSIIADDSAAGERAAFLLILKHLEKAELDEAEAIWNQQKRFSDSQQGAELLARIAVMNGDLERAEKAFLPWKEVSVEARLFFAKKAFDSGDFDRAEAITKELVHELPLNQQFKNNLEQIRAKRDEAGSAG